MSSGKYLFKQILPFGAGFFVDLPHQIVIQKWSINAAFFPSLSRSCLVSKMGNLASSRRILYLNFTFFFKSKTNKMAQSVRSVYELKKKLRS